MAQSLIPADVRSRLKELRLLSRHASGGQGIGAHRSRNRGVGLEFSQYRAYEPGDELRQIDWKLYARSDRFFVRESERESPLTVWILLDATASMGQRGIVDATHHRLHAAKGLTACIAELAMRQGDSFGMIALCDDGLRLLPATHGTRGRDRLLLELQTLDAGGLFPQTEKLKPVWERVAARDLVVMLTDGFDEAMIALAERLASAGREVLLIQLLMVEERDFPLEGGYLFRDPETDEQLPADGKALRQEFLARFAQAQQGLHARLDAAGIRHARYVLDEPLDQPLRVLFGQRGLT